MNDAGLQLLRAIEEMVRELRDEVREERAARDELLRLRRVAADRKAKQRATEQNGVTGQSRDMSRDSHGTQGSLKALKALEPEEAKDPEVTGQSRDKRVSRDKPDTKPTWEAYTTALRERHGVSPLRDKRANSQMLHFVDRVGVLDAPAIAAFYVKMNSDFYVKQRHPVSLLDAQAESIRAHWMAGREITATQARSQERTAANAEGWSALLSENGRKNALE